MFFKNKDLLLFVSWLKKKLPCASLCAQGLFNYGVSNTGSAKNRLAGLPSICTQNIS
jgi:hypothetical protein